MYDDNANPEEGYNHAIFERLCSNGVRQKASMSIISLEDVRSFKKKVKKSDIFKIYLARLKIL